MTASVKRRDITVTEEVGDQMSFTSLPPRYWQASLDGRLSTGETVSIDRQGDSFATALSALEQAIADQGWAVSQP